MAMLACRQVWFGIFFPALLAASQCNDITDASALVQSNLVAHLPREETTSHGRILVQCKKTGVTVWEHRARGSLVSETAKQRYAVAYVWSEPRKSDSTVHPTFLKEHHHKGHHPHRHHRHKHDYTSPFGKGRGACALAMSAIASREHMQRAFGETAEVDAVVLSDSISQEDADGLEEMGVRVLMTDLTKLYTPDKIELAKGHPYYKTHSAFFKERASVLKSGLAGLTEYKAIFYLDVDAYILQAPRNLTYFNENILNAPAEFFSTPCCWDAPLAAGRFILKPNQDAFESMMALMKVGFKSDGGWGHLNLRIGPDDWPEAGCYHPGPYTDDYCKEKSTTTWQFIAAEGDKGILFAEYYLIRRTHHVVPHEEFDSMMPSYNFWGPEKPWMPNMKCSPAYDIEPNPNVRHVPFVWKNYKLYSRPVMAENADQSEFKTRCTRYMDQGMAKYRRCLVDPEDERH